MRQEDRVLRRIERIKTIIKETGNISLKELDAWAFVTLGIRPRTLGIYLNSLDTMGLIKYDKESKRIMVK